jgi:ribonuclease PH
VIKLDLLGERTYTIDCDVLMADGGTRTASITGAYVALIQAMNGLVEKGAYQSLPVRCAVAAVSAGLVEGMPLLDLPYEEDFKAAVDFNVVATEDGELVEVQGTGEAHPFTRADMDQMLELCDKGCRELFEAQRQALAGIGIKAPAPTAA